MGWRFDERMTSRTKELILDFHKTRNINLVPSIIIGLQEDDSVSTTVQFKNSFRLLRNLAAHEPETITEQLLLDRNLNHAKAVFLLRESDDAKLTLDLAQLAAWLFDMRLKTGDAHYIVFCRTLIQVMCPCIVRYSPNKLVLSSDDLVESHAEFEDYLKTRLNRPSLSNMYDDYTATQFASNRRLFWRMTYPSMMEVISTILNYVDLTDEKTIQFYVNLFKEREGVCNDQ